MNPDEKTEMEKVTDAQIKIADDWIFEKTSSHWTRNDLRHVVAFSHSESERAVREFAETVGEDCQQCDNSGCYPTRDRHGDPEPNQCEFCYTEKFSKFNLRFLAESFLKGEK